MQYIPKYLKKRLVPRQFVKKVGDHIEFKFINVVSPISIADVFPEDLSEVIKVSIDGKELPIDQILNVELDIEGKTYKIPDVKELAGHIIPLGSEIQVRVPDPNDYIQAGSTHKISVWVQDSPDISLEMERTIN